MFHLMFSAALLALIGCYTKPPTVAVIPRTCGTLLWEPMHAGAVTQARQEGLHVYWNAPTQDDDVQKQLGFLRLALKRNYRGVIFVPDQTSAMRTPVEDLLSKVPVVVVNDDLELPPDPRLSYVSNDEAFGAGLAAARVAAVLHGKGAIAMIGIDPRRRSGQERAQSFEQALGLQAPHIRIVAREFGGANQIFEQQVAERVLRGPEHVSAIVALSAASTRGAFYAKIGMHPASDVEIVGFDQDILPPIKAGEINAVVMQRTFQIGVTAMKVMAAMLRSEQAPKKTLIRPVLLTREIIGSPVFNEQRSYVNFPWGQE